MDLLSCFLLHQKILHLGLALLPFLHIKSFLRYLFSFICNFDLLPSPSPADASWSLQAFVSSLILSFSFSQPRGLKASHQKGTLMYFPHSDPRHSLRPVIVEDIANIRRLWNASLALLISLLSWHKAGLRSELCFSFEFVGLFASLLLVLNSHSEAAIILFKLLWKSFWFWEQLGSMVQSGNPDANNPFYVLLSCVIYRPALLLSHESGS